MESDPERLLDFHLEHDPETRTVTVTTLIDHGGEQVKHTVTGRYDDGDNGPTLTYTHRWQPEGLTLTSDGVKDQYGWVQSPPMRADLTLALQLREAESHGEAMPKRFCGTCLKPIRGQHCATCSPEFVHEIGQTLRRRTPESRFAYLAEQRQKMVDRGADADELAVFDALAVAGWMGGQGDQLEVR